MTSLDYTDHDIKVLASQSQVIKEIRELRNEVRSVQKSIALVLRCLPYIVHDELSAHEREHNARRYFDY